MHNGVHQPSHPGLGVSEGAEVHPLRAPAPNATNHTCERELGAERDWSGALRLLQQAAEAIRASADQSEKVEARARGLLARATEEVQRARARIEDLEARLQDAETRATEAEARASVAEARVHETGAWLQRVHEAITTEFSTGIRLLDRSTTDRVSPVD